MNKRIKKLWIEALKSGEYEQGYDRLLNPGEKYDKFCCLGVLVDIYALEHPEERIWNVCQDEGVLPNKVMKWANLDRKNPKVRYRPLAGINDSGIYTFKMIANLIRRYL